MPEKAVAPSGSGESVGDLAVVDEMSVGKIIAVHLNYRSRAAERGKQPDYPSYFLKAPSTISHDGAAITRPLGCSLLAFEGEIALIMHRTPKNVPVAAAWSYVRAVSAANDVGVYDLRYADPGSNVHSKGWDGFTPIGPTLIDARRIDPATLRMRAWVDSVPAQDADADDVLFSPEYVIADLSRVLTLDAGDIILMGTPTGSTVVKPGQHVEVEVSAAGGVTSGRLRNQIVEGSIPIGSVGAPPRHESVDIVAAIGASGARSSASHPGEQRQKEADEMLPALTSSKDETEIRDLLQHLAESWNTGDVARYADLFVENATYITYFGAVVRGRKSIENQHRSVFTGAQGGARLRYAEPPAIQFLQPDVALVVVTGGLDLTGNPELGSDSYSSFLFVAVRKVDGWRFASYQHARRAPAAQDS